MPAPTRHEAKEHVLSLAFEGRWTHAEMAERVSVSTRTIERWTAAEDFRAELARRRANLAESLMGVAYADKASRIVALSQMAESARREYEARPLLEETRMTPMGETTTESFNRDAHEAFRKSLDDIAKELGERTNNTNANAAQIVVVAIAQDVIEAV
jgi:transcriptional regulator with XRE-family HTH domain